MKSKRARQTAEAPAQNSWQLASSLLARAEETLRRIAEQDEVPGLATAAAELVNACRLSGVDHVYRLERRLDHKRYIAELRGIAKTVLQLESGTGQGRASKRADTVEQLLTKVRGFKSGKLKLRRESRDPTLPSRMTGLQAAGAYLFEFMPDLLPAPKTRARWLSRSAARLAELMDDLKNNGVRRDRRGQIDEEEIFQRVAVTLGSTRQEAHDLLAYKKGRSKRAAGV